MSWLFLSFRLGGSLSSCGVSLELDFMTFIYSSSQAILKLSHFVKLIVKIIGVHLIMCNPRHLCEIEAKLNP